MIPLSFREFVDEHLDPLRGRRPDGIEGLIDPPAAPAARRIPRAATLIVTDSAETAALLTANAAHLPTEAAVLAETAATSRVRGRDVVAVHDADPRGCELSARLRDAGAGAVVDAGLHPPASDEGLPVIEGAPARLPRDLSADLEPAGVGWLRSGRRLEIASLGSAEICSRVGDAVLRLKEPERSAS